jgi:inosine-uridine nucleoside N-ribohydrolase
MMVALMNYRIFLLLFLVPFFLSCEGQGKEPVPIIFDSDMGPDYDDVGAITLLHAYADSGQANILATVASTNYEGVAAVLTIFNAYFGRPDILIGVPRGKALSLKDKQHWTDSLREKYPNQVMTNELVPDAVQVYRKVLASQPDRSVTIVTVGFLTNLSNLLQSVPDRNSNLNGLELVKKKVKQLVCMAGKFPEGSEFNVNQDAAASQYTYTHWPTSIIFSGFEIGWRIHTGLPLINNSFISNSPVKDVFRISIPLDKQDAAGRMSWDETAVLVAIKGYQPWYTLKQGKIIVEDNGYNRWTDGPYGQYHLVEAQPPVVVEELINRLIMHQPVKKP